MSSVWNAFLVFFGRLLVALHGWASNMTVRGTDFFPPNIFSSCAKTQLLLASWVRESALPSFQPYFSLTLLRGRVTTLSKRKSAIAHSFPSSKLFPTWWATEGAWPSQGTAGVWLLCPRPGGQLVPLAGQRDAGAGRNPQWPLILLTSSNSALLIMKLMTFLYLMPTFTSSQREEIIGTSWKNPPQALLPPQAIQRWVQAGLQLSVWKIL